MDFLPELCKLLALEYNCDPAALEKEDVLITNSRLHPGRRMYNQSPHIFHMVTLGGGAVITADPSLHPFLRDWSRHKEGHWLFELPNLQSLEQELNRHGYRLGQSHHMFLPTCTPSVRPEFPVQWLTEFDGFYDGRFPNALCTEPDPNRPDLLAVCGLSEGGSILGMAGCSRDAENWWQIGIDVFPQYRHRGVGKTLVALLTAEILRRGAIPFYGTSLSNYRSWNTALSCGFRPVWVEIGAKKQRTEL